MNKKALIKGEMKNILPSCLCIALLDPVLMVIYGLFFAQNNTYQYVSIETTFSDGLKYAFGDSNGAMSSLSRLSLHKKALKTIIFSAFSWWTIQDSNL